MKVASCVCVVYLISVFYGIVNSHINRSKKEAILNREWKQTWDYVNVRPHAYMFWWLYYSAAARGYENSPLVIWLQGGPGSSSTGFGNFVEIGPVDVNLNYRNTTWVLDANVLFIDNPVGTGFSYVTDDSAYTTDNNQIATDLVTTLSTFLNKHPEFQKIPLYIFSESYGGKMAAEFSWLLLKKIKTHSVSCNFKGVALGDSWISPIDSVLTWGPFLYATSLIDETGLKAINEVARRTKEALDRGDFFEATSLWGETENVLERYAGNVNIYNILKWGDDSYIDFARYRAILRRDQNAVKKYTRNDDLSALMNGPIKKSLGIIPENVTWGGQSSEVFSHLSVDFMKPVVDIVSWLLDDGGIDVVVYSGQLDVIVDTLGTELWVQKMSWKGLPHYNNATRVSFRARESDSNVAGFYKTWQRFSFYWIMNAGHMIPTDAGDAARKMLQMILKL